MHEKTLAMTADHFTALSAYLYGEAWKAAIARETATEPSKIREMAKGKRRVSPKIATHLLDAMAANRDDVEAAEEIARAASAQFARFTEASFD